MKLIEALSSSSLLQHKKRINRNKTKVAPIKCRRFVFLFLSMILVVISIILTKQIVSADDSTEVQKTSQLSPEEHVDKLISSIEPRQYFKVNINPASSSEQRKTKKLRAPKGSGNNFRRSAAAAAANNQNLSSSSTDTNPDSNENQSLKTTTSQKSQQLSKQKAITNATLKKLLNQSLANKSMNGTSSSSLSPFKQPNFKFVFIQRATASPNAPNNNYNKGDKSKSPTSSSENNTESDDDNKKSKSSKPIQSSLAASVSKQLASSLLTSAANIVANITSTTSLSSLASQIVAHSLAEKLPSSAASAPSPADNNSINLDSLATSESSPTTSSQEDIKRINSDTSKTTAGSKAASNNNNNNNEITKQKTKSNIAKTRRPSKIYNLPVKFVSNGQPNMIVFNTIRQHFATIKKLQMATTKLHANVHSKYGAINNNNNNKYKRPIGNQKGKGNSRLIYLPLKYLSNARPNKILISKATHKSNS